MADYPIVNRVRQMAENMGEVDAYNTTQVADGAPTSDTHGKGLDGTLGERASGHRYTRPVT